MMEASCVGGLSHFNFQGPKSCCLKQSNSNLVICFQVKMDLIFKLLGHQLGLAFDAFSVPLPDTGAKSTNGCNSLSKSKVDSIINAQVAR